MKANDCVTKQNELKQILERVARLATYCLSTSYYFWLTQYTKNNVYPFLARKGNKDI